MPIRRTRASVRLRPTQCCCHLTPEAVRACPPSTPPLPFGAAWPRYLAPPLTRQPAVVGRLIVDGTAGLGGTSLRLAHGFNCDVTAVEASGPLACLLDYGLVRMAAEPKEWASAASRVTAVHADTAVYLGGVAAADRPCVVYLNPCMELKKLDRVDAFLHEVARLQPISGSCLHAALAAATCRVVLRVPHGHDPAEAAHGTTPSRTIHGGQSDFLVFETCPKR